MQAISQFLNRIANWKTFVFFLGCYIFFVAVILKNAEIRINELAGKTVGIIDLTVGFNPQKTLDMVAAYGDEGRAYYARTEMTADVAYPIVYAFFFGIILTMLYRGKRSNWVNVLPFVALAFDYAENGILVTLLKSFPQQSYPMAVVCEVFKMGKWMAFGASVVLILGGLVLKLMGLVKRQKVVQNQAFAAPKN